MKSLFRFLHIANILLTVGTLTAYAVSNTGLSWQFWLGFYQLALGIIQLLSLRFFTPETKTKAVLYWAFVGAWLLMALAFAPVQGAGIVTLYVIPLGIACYSVYVSWYTLRDFIWLDKRQQPTANN